MESQEQNTAEHQAPAISTSTPKAGDEQVSSNNTTSTANGDSKEFGGTDGTESSEKENASKKHLKSKHKKAKTIDEADEASGSDSGTDARSTSSESDPSDSDKKPNKKNTHRKRHSPAKMKKSQAQKPQKRVKSRKTDSSGSDSDSNSSDDEDDVESGQETSLSSQKDLAKQFQLLQIQQQLQAGSNPYQFNNPMFPAGIASPSISPVYGQYIPINTNNVPRARRGGITGSAARNNLAFNGLDPRLLIGGNKRQKEKKKRTNVTKLEYRRVDEVWDRTIHNTKLQDTVEGAADDPADEFLFHVRRTFDWEGKYKTTIIDIDSKLLRECLQDVMGDIYGLSLVEETPKVDPNMLFLYLEDLREYRKVLKKATAEGSRHERKKEQKRIDSKREHLKILIRYIDKDYADVKASLYPMLENGLITFELLWALWKPDTLAYTTTYGSHDEPRLFKVDMAEKHISLMRGTFYYIEGKYFEYDGKRFGFGSISEEVEEFRGARKITSLECYPLKYHKNKAQLRKELIDRGKKFVSLSGVHYKSLQGMAYYKRKRSVIKVSINGRIMVDPSTHRRINPNYPISLLRPGDHDMLDSDEDSGGETCEAGFSDSGDADERSLEGVEVKYVTKILMDKKGRSHAVHVPNVASDDENKDKELLHEVSKMHRQDEACVASQDTETPQEHAEQFSDEQYLIASPVVLGFSFAEKLWLEFTVSAVEDIHWNENAYESLVLEPKTKDIVKALVESHKYHAAESIDDVIQGKGKGLVAVLHGPPGTGKTLTAEGISELLKAPLYFVSAGELGTDSRYLENELQKILDICHAWGAILLLDEADVFLEKRNMHDLHRNALVSIFLRQLEYFQGILFLTTNRVEAWDEAFNSRVHIALKYDNLDHRAKKAIFKIFLERVRVISKLDIMPFTEEDLNVLARHELNGRQIKNTVRTAQALAVNGGEPLSMSHITSVLEVQMKFQNDLAGGPGYEEAMRSYF